MKMAGAVFRITGRFGRVSFLLTFFLAAGALASPPVSITLPPAADATISSDGANPRGVQTILSGTRENLWRDRGLLRFDFSAIPAGAVIQSAVLRLQVVMIPRSPAESNFSLHRMLRAWTDAANWTSASPGLPWAAEGALEGVDYIADGSAAQRVQGLGVYTFGPGAALAADVQAWLNAPESNHGWILLTDRPDTGSTARHFGSSESAQPPQLVIEYSLPPSEGPQLTDPEAGGGLFSFRFTASSATPYRVEARADAGSGAWVVVTNLPPVAAAGPVTVTDAISAPRRIYRVASE